MSKNKETHNRTEALGLNHTILNRRSGTELTIKQNHQYKKPIVPGAIVQLCFILHF